MKITITREFEIEPQFQNVQINVEDDWQNPTKDAFVDIDIPFKFGTRITNFELKKIIMPSEVGNFMKKTLIKVIEDNWSSIVSQLNNRTIQGDGEAWCSVVGKTATLRFSLIDPASMQTDLETHIMNMKVR